MQKRSKPTECSSDTEARNDADWAEARRKIRKRVVREAGEIVAAAIVKAKAGHYQAMKYLFELAGLFPDIAEENSGDDFSLARMLCDRLGLPPSAELGREVVEAEIVEADDSKAGRGNGHALK